MIKAIIFDLDDTLISEREYIKSGYRAVSEYITKKYCLECDDVYKKLCEKFEESSRNVFNRFFEEKGIIYNDQDIRDIVEVYRSHKPDIKFFGDVLPTIKSLKDKGIKIGIITDGHAKSQRLKLEVLNAYEIFDEIIITDELGREYWKPHPKAFELMKERLGIEFDEMIYVGDNPEKDFFISNIYPIKCVRVYRSNGIYMETEYLKDIKERYSVKNLNEIISLEGCKWNQ